MHTIVIHISNGGQTALIALSPQAPRTGIGLLRFAVTLRSVCQTVCSGAVRKVETHAKMSRIEEYNQLRFAYKGRSAVMIGAVVQGSTASF